jgi:hypothetical protein
LPVFAGAEPADPGLPLSTFLSSPASPPVYPSIIQIEGIENRIHLRPDSRLLSVFIPSNASFAQAGGGAPASFFFYLALFPALFQERSLGSATIVIF